MTSPRPRPLLLGEWACLGILAEGPAHGYTVAQRLSATGDLGRIWSLSRALTYRALGHVLERGFTRELKPEPGIAGGMRTPMDVTAKGRRALTAWLAEPVPHLRDVRNELLVKLQLCQNLGIDWHPLVEAQRERFVPVVASLRTGADDEGIDPVATWRDEYSAATMHFLDRLAAATFAPR